MTFRLLERVGLHVTRRHYYSPVPDTRELSEDLWTTQAELPGVDLREDEQVARLEGFASSYRDEYASFVEPTSDPRQFHVPNGWFERVDSEILYCMVRHYKPKHVIEIGGGNSSLITTKALLKNAAESPSAEGRLTTVEPFPNETLRGGLPGLSELVVSPVQQVPVSRFEELGAGDILFIDSSHVLRIGSDVQYEYLEILPRLAPGVVIHIHDFFRPAEYPRHLIMDARLFWNEHYLVQAFLAFNKAFEVRWASSFMHLRHADALRSAFPSYDVSRMWPSSLWLERVVS